MLANNKQSEPVAVMPAYRNKNHGPPLPKPQALRPSAVHDSDASDANSEDDNSETKPTLKRRASRQTKEPNPQSLGYYPPAWKYVLIQAKRKWQYHVAVRNPFPDREEHLGEAETVLARAISDYEADGGILEDGMTTVWCSVLYANYFLGFEQDRNMNILVSILFFPIACKIS